MNHKQLRKIALPTIALLTALSLTITMGMLSREASMDLLFGSGKRLLTAVDGAKNSDANYYTQAYATSQESLAAAYKVAKQISDEGIVLLKNDGALPLEASQQISPFGLRYQAPFYGGDGSAAIDEKSGIVVSAKAGLHASFSHINSLLETLMEQAYADSTLASTTPVYTEVTQVNTLYEFSPDIYAEAASTCAGSVGLVYIGRRSGESNDAVTTPYSDGTPHMLALTEAERETLRFAKRYCDKVVVVIESSAPMELAALEDDTGINAIVWVGGTGCAGYASLGEILCGKVTPSGRTPDIYPADFTQDPTFANFDDGSDDFLYSNAFTTIAQRDVTHLDTNAPFQEYEEGVYVGYKYYETSYDIGHLTDYYSRKNGVVYPFGYGLSYASFTQEIVELIETEDAVSATVLVTNNGVMYAGKEVIQLYVCAPYSEFDESYGIEKPTAALLQFAKTKALQPGQSEQVTLSFLKEDMASYCYTRENPDGSTGCYVLETGDYAISLRSDSHTVLGSALVTIPKTIWYDSSHPRQSETTAQSMLGGKGESLVVAPSGEFQAATNQFEQINNYMTDETISGAVILSRKDWAGTQPTAPTVKDRFASKTVAEWITESDSTVGRQMEITRKLAESDTTVQQDAGSIVLADLRGKDYNDPLWAIFLQQLTFADVSELHLCLMQGAYQTGKIKEIGKPSTIERDGPQGLTQPSGNGENWLKGTCSYPASPVMGATWNRQLMADFGEMVAQEALVAGINGWYAPGLNLHRSPFGGRVAEYFSEDGVLAGCLAAEVIASAGDSGLYCAVKHLALMENEAHRTPHRSTWLTEQALRETYLKPFEIALKSATKTILYWDGDAMRSKTMRAGDFIMTSDCAIGTVWSAANSNLLEEVLRGEWGFQGAVITDYVYNSNGNQVGLMQNSGGDILMSLDFAQKSNMTDFQGRGDVQDVLRNSIKNLCYTVVNSNAMQGATPGTLIQYGLAPWKFWLIAMNGVVLLLTLLCFVWFVILRRSSKGTR